jgi:putative DNA primase/helicase
LSYEDLEEAERRIEERRRPRQNGTPPYDEDESRPIKYADEALALHFTSRHEHNLRFVNRWGRWLIWDGHRWRADETLRAFDLARAIARETSAEIVAGNGPPKLASMVASAKTVAAVERLARADRRHASGTDDWDADPWLLNAPTGTVDLRTGRLRAHSRADLITKMTAVAPNGDCRLWLVFLDRVFEGNKELVAFHKRILGYCLTGSIREHALFFLYGTGGNGKGVLLNTLHGILGDYSGIAAMETFTASKADRHPTDVAMLRGARVVIAQETEDGQRWAESRIKALTGGDPISARFMRQDFFTFNPSFKLLIAGNHKPSLRNVDEAVKRRFNLLPFTVTIPKGERDLELAAKLKAEWSGILAWAIEGCLEWQRIGLCPPPTVINATESYLADEDAIGRFLDQCCATDNQDPIEEVNDLYACWRVWCTAGGEYVGSIKRFSQNLENRKFERCQHPLTRRSCFRGVRLLVRSNTMGAGLDGSDPNEF